MGERSMVLCAALAMGTLASSAAFSIPSAHRGAAFVPAKGSAAGPSPQLLTRRESSTPSPSALHMCICINCARVTDCAAYHFVETKHEQPHINPSPQFEPRDGSPTINATFRTVMSERAESEFERMVKEHKAEEAKAVERARAEGVEVEDPNDSPVPLFGDEKYDLSPITTIEYDVVACEDFKEDKDCWVRNMPEEIRLANPDFVPT